MKVAILSESEVDAAALRVLLQAIRGEKTEFAQPTTRRAGAWHRWSNRQTLAAFEFIQRALWPTFSHAVTPGGQPAKRERE